MKNYIISTAFALSSLQNSAAFAEASISALDRSLTTMSKLKNNIPLIIRETSGSDIVHFEINLKTGTAQASPEKRVIDALVMETMNRATKRYPKTKLFELTEKYSSSVGCGAGVESSKCGFTTVTEYLPQMLDILSSTITEPVFTNEDFELVRKQKIASFQHDIQNPEAYVNTLVNSIFYEAGHPYRFLSHEGIKQAEVAKVNDLKERYKFIFDASLMTIVYVGPKLTPQLLGKINQLFGGIPVKNATLRAAPPPQYNPKQTFAFENRPIPTAYIRVKFNAPAADSPDAPTSDLLFEMLSNKLHEEIRTKRSLSYSIGAMNLAYSQGIGTIVASTSKPKETLEVVASVINSFREKAPSQTDVDENRNIFTTSYYTTMESQSQLAGALYNAWHYNHDFHSLYEMQSKLERVSPQDILRLSQSMLKNFRIGIVFDRSKFKDEWLAPIQKIQ